MKQNKHLTVKVFINSITLILIGITKNDKLNLFLYIGSSNSFVFFLLKLIELKLMQTLFITFILLFNSNCAEKKPKPENIDIYTLKITTDRRCKVIKLTLADVWKQGCIIRINNFGDKDKTPHSEKDIKNQVRNSLLLFCFQMINQTNRTVVKLFVNSKNDEYSKLCLVFE